MFNTTTTLYLRGINKEIHHGDVNMKERKDEPYVTIEGKL